VAAEDAAATLKTSDLDAEIADGGDSAASLTDSIHSEKECVQCVQQSSITLFVSERRHGVDLSQCYSGKFTFGGTLASMASAICDYNGSLMSVGSRGKASGQGVRETNSA